MAEPDLAELKEMRGALMRARASGHRAVVYAHNGVEYRTDYKTDSDMAAALADLDRRIAALSGASPVNTIRLTTSKGL
jgi:poly-gamma-glutamate capsule biosynthesis protein CapA/YwtB (metallophosphatase superfamily)